MDGHRARLVRLGNGKFIPARPEHVLNAVVSGNVQYQGPCTSPLQPFIAILFTQPYHAEAGPVPMNDQGAGCQNLAGHLCTVRPNRSRPGQQAWRRPFQILLMCRRLVFREGGVPAFLVVACMNRDPLALVEQLDPSLRKTSQHPLPDELIRGAVIVAIDLDMVVKRNGLV